MNFRVPRGHPRFWAITIALVGIATLTCAACHSRAGLNTLPPIHLGIALGLVLWGGWRMILPATLAVAAVVWLADPASGPAGDPISTFWRQPLAPPVIGAGLLFAWLAGDQTLRPLVTGRVDHRLTTILLGVVMPLTLLPGVFLAFTRSDLDGGGSSVAAGATFIVGLGGLLAGTPLALALLPSDRGRSTYACHCRRPLVPVGCFTVLLLIGLGPTWIPEGIADWLSAGRMLAILALGTLALASGWLATAIGSMLLLATTGLTTTADPLGGSVLDAPLIDLLPPVLVGLMAAGVGEEKFRSRQEIADSRDELRTLVEVTDAALIRTNHRGEVVVANAAAVETLGRDAVRRGARIQQAFGRSNRARLRAFLGSSSDDGRPREVELPIISPDGVARRHRILCTASHDESGRVDGHTFLVLDVHERHRTEVARRRLLRRDMRSVAGAMMHDLNTLAMEVGGLAAMAMEHDSDPATRAALAHIEDSCEAVGRRTRRLRPLAEGRSVDLRPTDVSRVVAERLDAAAAAEGTGRIRPRLQPGLLSPVDSDFVAFVMDELVQNAIESRIEPVDLDVWFHRDRTDETRLVLEFRDDGPGLDPELARRIGRHCVSTKGPGRGLGIRAIASGLRACGGSLRLRNLRPGLSVTITLPAVTGTPSRGRMRCDAATHH